MAGEQKTFLDDRESFEELLRCMPEGELRDYDSYGALNMEFTFPGRNMVIYTLSRGLPTDIVVIRFGELTVDPEYGPRFTITDPDGELPVNAVPSRYRNRDLFLHAPQNFTLRYRGVRSPKQGVDFVSHYAVLVKTRSKEIHQIEGHQYCVTIAKFRERFPDLKLRY